MGIAQNARSIQRVVWVDEQGAPHIILLAYLGDKVIWDGHISQTVQVPRALSFSRGWAPEIMAEAKIAVPAALSYSEALTPVVTGGVTIAPPVAMSTSQAYAPTLFSDQIIDIPVALSTSQAYAPEIRVVFGVTPPVALSSSQAYAPVVHADSAVTPPRAQSYSQAYAPVVGSYVFINPPVALSASQAYAPVMHADQNITVPRATSTSQAYAPVPHGDQNIAVPRATSTSQAYAPTVTGGGFSRQRMVKSGNNTASSNSAQVVPNWTSDGTHPGTVSGNTLVVQSGGPATVTFHADYQNNGLVGSATIYLYRNGTQIASASIPSGSGIRDLTWTGTLVHGDVLDARYANATVDTTYPITIKGTTSYLDVNPT